MFLRVHNILIVIMTLLVWSNTAVAENPEKMAIFYPQAKEPYRSIYQEILAGTQNAISTTNPNVELEEFVINKSFDSENIESQLRKQNIKKVIVLGRAGFKLAKKLSKDFNIVSGALPITPNGISGISLIADPAYLFNYLDQVAPDVKRIHVAHSQRSEWLINMAKLAAKEKGLELNAQKVSNTKEAVEFYQQLFESNISKEDAIWLPLDSISSHDKITLPLILEKAWTREVVVFSSKPSHAKRGALFSTYPDNFALGQHLYKMVQELDQQPEQKNFAALTSTLLAVNLRTAAHLGLKYSLEQQQQFKLTFPE